MRDLGVGQTLPLNLNNALFVWNFEVSKCFEISYKTALFELNKDCSLEQLPRMTYQKRKFNKFSKSFIKKTFQSPKIRSVEIF